jgi:nitrogen fixation protein FixH
VKLFIYILYGIFLSLIIITFYIANRVYDGVIENNYYEKSKNYFLTKEKEGAIGLKVSLLGSVKIGNNDFIVKIGLNHGILKGAKVRLFIGNVANTGYDDMYDLTEDSPGIYRTLVNIPFKGEWILRLNIESKDIKTEKRWFIAVN